MRSDFIRQWSSAYEAGMPEEEIRLFDVVGPAVRARGHFEPEELRAATAWKTKRSRSRVARNSDDDIRDITRTALAAPERLQHRILCLLSGVQVATATALLAVALPDRHTVMDVRSIEALRRLDEWDGAGGYPAYLEVCRRLAADAGVDLRTLDRALWRWSKDGYPSD